MKKLLPFLAVALFLIGAVVVRVHVQHVYAASGDDGSSVGVGTTDSSSLDDKWVADPEVTFVGKAANRANDFLNWTLQNYNWICVKPLGNPGQCDNSNNPLVHFWFMVVGTVYALMFLFVLAAAFIMIVTRGQNITIMKFAPRFALMLVLVILSFTIVKTLYDVGDIIQGFLLHVDGPTGKLISSSDLLYISFPYKFNGFRLMGMANDESAFITLLLVKLTAITYYVMSGILIVRKIILWFFLIVSPVFPLLILYRPIRNTAKIWVGEFFRWLLYAPLFALFLNGLVVLWRSEIPLPFNFSGAGTQTTYPTAVNILIGGPGQVISMTNSVNLKDTFVQYVVALIMLWVVILLPFLLLRIFLDYLNTVSLGNGLWMKQAINRNLPFMPHNPSAGPLPPPPPSKVFPAGMARPLPIGEKAARTISTSERPMVQTQTVQNLNTEARTTNDILKTVNISIPKMRDIARYETAMLSKDSSKTQEVTQYHDTLEKIANPNIVTQPLEREKFSVVREQLVRQKANGNQVASNILSTASTTNISSMTNMSSMTHGIRSTTIHTGMTQRVDTQQIIREVLQHLANPTSVVVPSQRLQVTQLREKLTAAKSQGDPVASKVLVAAEKVADKTTTKEQRDDIIKNVQNTIQEGKQSGNQIAAQVESFAQTQGEVKSTQSLPAVNKVQQVSIEEFEEIRKMWVENYENLEPPRKVNGEQYSREEWVTNDIDNINEAVGLLGSSDEQKVNEGMQMVSNILPFLLLGGFSKSEVTTYLKAKLEAAKEVIGRSKKKQEEEDSMLPTGAHHAQESQEMSAQAQADMPSENTTTTKEYTDQKTLEEESKNNT